MSSEDRQEAEPKALELLGLLYGLNLFDRAEGSANHRLVTGFLASALADQRERLAKDVPPPCDPDVFSRGKLVCVIAGLPMRAIEEWIVAARPHLKDGKLDWHYVGGRGVVMTTGDHIKALRAIQRFTPAMSWAQVAEDRGEVADE